MRSVLLAQEEKGIVWPRLSAFVSRLLSADRRERRRLEEVI